MQAAPDHSGRRHATGGLIALVLVGALSACVTRPPSGAIAHAGGTMAPYQVKGVWYRPREQPDYEATGIAIWYGAQYHYRRTADGELFDMDRPSGAHTTLPLPCIVEVTNLDNGRRIRLRINDRGPFVSGRIVDVSRAAAKDLGFYDRGSARVRVRYIGPASSQDGVGAAETPASGASVAARAAPGLVDRPEVRPDTAYASGPIVRVQVAAFADREAALHTAAAFGDASIEPVDRPGGRLWRVVVRGAPGEDAGVLRLRAAQAGFPGARVVGSPAGGPG